MVSPAPRHLVLAAVVAAHAAGFTALALGDAVEVATGPAAAIEVFAVAAPPVPAAAPPITLARVAAEAQAPVFEIAVVAAAVPGAGCAIAENVQRALSRDAAVRAALVAVPAAARSVANAVLVWDGRWAAVDALGGTAADNPIRRTIVAEVVQASPACRETAIVGPRLFVVAADSAPMALAFGSGTWRWSELLS